MRVQVRCAYCCAEVLKEARDVNRSTQRGAPVYCGRECAGLGRRKWKSQAQKKAEKSAYDAQRRVELADRIKAEKHAYYKRTYDPVKAAVVRKRRMPRHVEYCRRPEYVEWKREYDRAYRAAKEYGEFADCFLLVMDIRAECLTQMTDYEIRLSKGTLNKRIQRRRNDERTRTLGKDAQSGPVGDLERGKGWQNGGLASGLRRLPSPRNSADHEYTASRGSAGQASGCDGRDQLRGGVTGRRHSGGGSR